MLRCHLFARSVALVIALTGCVTASWAQQDSLDRDYAEQLPRIRPLSPGEALDSFQLAEGLRIDQLASEPLVVDPIAMAFDEDGRLFVVEMRDYSEDDKLHLGRVRLLEDTDHDGRYDRSHVYVDGLSWPTALICYDGGVFVGAAPDIWYCKDHDRDGRAEDCQVVFTGFGRSNVQGLLNTFLWGLDNRIHGATSSSGAELRRVVDGKPHDDVLTLRGRDFAFDPRTLQIEAISGGGQHGVSFDDWGHKLVCSNSNHIQQVMFEDHYLARNPYLAAPAAAISIAEDGPQAPVFRNSPVEPWRIVRTRLRVQGLVPGPVEGGGTPAGYFTGATGVTVYRGHQWHDDRQLAIVGDVGSNLVHRKQLVPDGLRFVARRVDQQSEMLRSSDIWFRPVQFANAPDGGLYIADMYREVIEHPASLPPIIKQHLDLTSGRDRGRIYRLTADGFQQPEQPRLGTYSTAQLVATLNHPNGWHRDTAARLLYQRQDPASAAALEALIEQHPDGLGCLHALYALNSLQSGGQSALSAKALLIGLTSPAAPVRRHALRLSEQMVADAPQIREAWYCMLDDSSLEVRRQLAFSLGVLRGPRRNAALAQLLADLHDDPWCRLAVRSSLEQGTGDVLARLCASPEVRSTAAGRIAIAELAAQVGKQQSPVDVQQVLQVLADTGRTDQAVAEVILKSLAAAPGSPLADQLAQATGGNAARMTAQLVARAQQQSLDSDQKLEDRLAAIQLLRLGGFQDLRETLGRLLDPREDPSLQDAALQVMASFRDPDVADLVLDRWKTFTPRLRNRAADVLFSRTPWLTRLLQSVAAGRLPSGDLDPRLWKMVTDHPDSSIRELAGPLLAGRPTGNREGLLAEYQQALSGPSDLERGREVFKKVCASCHQVQGVGYALAPNLAAMQNRGPETILVNVLDPNREVNPQYLNYTLATTDGRVLSGMIVAETANSVTLKRADDATDTVLRIDIDELRSSGLSLMPDGLEKQIDKQAMADLVAYLMQIE